MQIHVIPAHTSSPLIREEIDGLCERAYGEDLRAGFNALTGPVHVVGIVGDVIVSHALWVTRWLQPDDGPLLRTAYVEGVATDPAHQGRGYASAVLQALVREIRHFDLAALCAAGKALALYARLGWEQWQGPLSIRQPNGRIATPDETVMIYRLPGTPELNLGDGLSAEWRAGELW